MDRRHSGGGTSEGSCDELLLLPGKRVQPLPPVLVEVQVLVEEQLEVLAEEQLKGDDVSLLSRSLDRGRKTVSGCSRDRYGDAWLSIATPSKRQRLNKLNGHDPDLEDEDR